MTIASCTPKYEYWVWDGNEESFAEIAEWGANLRQREGYPDILEYFYPTSTWNVFPVGGVVVRMFPGVAPYLSTSWGSQAPTNAGAPVVVVYETAAEFEEAFTPVV